MNSGRMFVIRHPGMAIVSQTTLHLAHPSKDDERMAERASPVGLPLIEEIRPLEESRRPNLRSDRVLAARRRHIARETCPIITPFNVLNHVTAEPFVPFDFLWRAVGRSSCIIRK